MTQIYPNTSNEIRSVIVVHEFDVVHDIYLIVGILYGATIHIKTFPFSITNLKNPVFKILLK